MGAEAAAALRAELLAIAGEAEAYDLIDVFDMLNGGSVRAQRKVPTGETPPFLQQLGLRSILYLCPEEYPDSHLGFLEEQGVQLLHFGVTGNKEPFDEMSDDVVRAALRAVIDPANHPLLIHCNQGKHRTGCLVGCFRKAQRWSLVAIFEEYRRYADRKARIVDQQFIERIDLSAEEELYERGGAVEPRCCNWNHFALRVER